MSKGNSGLFHGTIGANASVLLHGQDLILSRVSGMDLREHPRGKSLSSKQRKEIAAKIKSRAATKREYEQYYSDSRFAKRRKEGVRQFWVQEQMRILSGKETTRDWSEPQRQAILRSERPKYKGKTVQGHHTYSASKYPHLANQGAVIFPVTFDEHLYGWHGGNFKNSLPGRPIKKKTYHNFSGGKKK